MSTIVLEDASMERLKDQPPRRPWTKKPTKFTVSVALAVVIPAIIVGWLFQASDIPGPVIAVAVYLPLQLVAAGLTALFNRGLRSVGDSVIVVLAIGATIFSLVVLISVIASLIVRGFQALSPHFLYQNSVYINPSTPLEYGGIGHAMVGTLLILAISTVIAVPIGIATAVYITEVRGRAVAYVRFFVQAMSGVPSVVAGLFIFDHRGVNRSVQSECARRRSGLCDF